MRDKDIYKQIHSVPEPWRITDVELMLDNGQVEVLMSMLTGAELPCPTCHGVCPRYDKRSRCWKHLDTCQYLTVAVVDVPLVQCAEHGIKQIDVPWAEARSRFTALFEILVIGWLKQASVDAVSRQLNLELNRPRL